MRHQITGSINLGTEGLVLAVAEHLGPALDAITEQIRLIGEKPATLSEEQMIHAIAHHLPSGVLCPQMQDGGNSVEIARFLTEHLTRAGYALVAVGGQALEAEAAKTPVTPPTGRDWFTRSGD